MCGTGVQLDALVFRLLPQLYQALDGCGWDRKKVCCVDQAPKVLFYELPVLLLSAMLEKRKKLKVKSESSSS